MVARSTPRESLCGVDMLTSSYIVALCWPAGNPCLRFSIGVPGVRLRQQEESRLHFLCCLHHTYSLCWRHMNTTHHRLAGSVFFRVGFSSFEFSLFCQPSSPQASRPTCPTAAFALVYKTLLNALWTLVMRFLWKRFFADNLLGIVTQLQKTNDTDTEWAAISTPSKRICCGLHKQFIGQSCGSDPVLWGHVDVARTTRWSSKRASERGKKGDLSGFECDTLVSPRG